MPWWTTGRHLHPPLRCAVGRKAALQAGRARGTWAAISTPVAVASPRLERASKPLPKGIPPGSARAERHRQPRPARPGPLQPNNSKSELQAHQQGTGAAGQRAHAKAATHQIERRALCRQNRMPVISTVDPQQRQAAAPPSVSKPGIRRFTGGPCCRGWQRITEQQG